jgi:putative restriction endonuclease
VLSAKARPDNDGLPWTREQTILAFDLYCRIPFRQTTAKNPPVQDLAADLSRTPASVARKLGNFGAFDPDLARRNITGLSHSSRLDRQIWDEFHNDWSALVTEAGAIRLRLTKMEFADPSPGVPDGPSDRIVTAVQRLHQAFFREAVLTSYDTRCCITGLPIPECLVAGHIIPWRVDEQRRADPTNGLCLSATFDRLFDRGLITLSSEFRLLVSPRLRALRDESVRREIVVREGQQIQLPARFPPSLVCLDWHRQNVFQAGD